MPPFRKAISLHASHIPAYVNLADLLRAEGRDDEGETVLLEALMIAPDSAHVHHALGLLLIRRRTLEEALNHLAQASSLQPEESRYAFVYGIALHDFGDMNASLTVLEDAHGRAPSNRDVLQTLLSYNLELDKRSRALHWARKLAELIPDDQSVRRVIEALEDAP